MSRLLVVDDEPQTISALQRYAEQQVLDCWMATTVKEAIEMLTTHQPDLIIVDLHLEGTRPTSIRSSSHPYTDGFDVLQTAKIRYPDSTVIVMTDCRDQSHPGMAKDLGADGFLTKPFTLEEFSLYIGLIYPD